MIQVWILDQMMIELLEIIQQEIILIVVEITIVTN